MRKVLLQFGLLIIANSLSGNPIISEHDSTIYSTLELNLQRQDSLLSLINERTKIYNHSLTKIQHAILLEVSRSDSLMKSIASFVSAYIQGNYELVSAILSGFNEVTTKIPRPSKLLGILGSIIGAVLSGAFAIWVFVQGKKNDKKKEEKSLFNYGEETYTLLKNITINSKKQIDLLIELVKSINEHPHSHGKYQHMSFNLLKRAQSLDAARVFNTFQYLKLEKKSYIIFYTSIDFLLEEFINIDNDYHSNSSEIITPLSNNFLKLRQEIFNQGTEFIEIKRREAKTDDPFYQFINNLIIEYYKSPLLPDTVDISYDFEMLIKPIKPAIIKYFRDYDQANSILNLAKEAGDIYTSITQINKEFGENVEGQITNLNSMIEKLVQIENELKTMYAS